MDYREEPLSQKTGCVRALIGEGLEVVGMVMPQLVCEVKPKYWCGHDDLEADDVKRALAGFDTEWIMSYPRQPNRLFTTYWGKVTFRDIFRMEDAVETVNVDDDVGFTLVPCAADKSHGRTRDCFLKLRWCRRKGLEHCFVKLENPEDKERLVGYKVKIGSAGPVKVHKSKGKSDLVIYNIEADFTQDQVIEALAKRLQICPQDNADRFKVIIPRKDVKYHTNEMERVHKTVATQVSNFVELDKFTVNVLKFEERSVYCMAFVKFLDAKDCQTAAKGLLRSGIRVGDDIAKVTVEFQGSLIFPQNIYKQVKADVDNYMKKINEKFSPRTLQLRELKSEDVSVNISAVSQHKLAKMTKDLNKIIKGDIVEPCAEENQDELFTNQAKVKLKEIETATEIEILINDKARKITLHGLRTDRKNALCEIEGYLNQTVEASKAVLDLKAEKRPPGLLRALLMRYGPDLEKMKSRTRLRSIKLGLKEHTIKMSGDKDALLKAEEVVDDVVEEKILEEYEKDSFSESDDPDCAVCLSPVDSTHYYCLQFCQHVYCEVCVVSLVQSCIRDHAFPIKCMVAKCGECINISDVDELSMAGLIEKGEVIQAAVRSFIRKNNSKYRFCISPMCEMVYKVGMNFRCPECRTCICTTCHLPVHQGVTCKSYNRVKSN